MGAESALAVVRAGRARPKEKHAGSSRIVLASPRLGVRWSDVSDCSMNTRFAYVMQGLVLFLHALRGRFCGLVLAAMSAAPELRALLCALRLSFVRCCARCA